MSKSAKTYNEAWEIQETYTGKPHGFIRWKNTDVCMDVYCECGCLSHIDGEFLNHVKCPECDQIYFCNGHIELIKLEIEPEQTIGASWPVYE